MSDRSDTIIALVGKPNSGKSALFNSLTGARQKVANYPGVTVERKEGVVKINDQPMRLLDLPGTYSLDAESIDEQITCDALQGKIEGLATPDVIVCLVDATNLRLSLRLALETISLGLPTVVALNKIDRAEKQGICINVDRLSQELGVPVKPVCATKMSESEGRKALLDQVSELIPESPPKAKPFTPYDSTRVRHVFEVAIEEGGEADRVTLLLDKVLLNPVLGPLSFFALVFLMFQGVFNLAAAPMDMIDEGVASLIALLDAVLPDGIFKSMINDGMVAGVGSVIIFLPQILILFFFILVLEESGYMARAAFLLDRIMGRVGLHGKAFIPLLSSFACAIPGIMAARTIESHRDRLVTILIAPLMTCSARLPVYALVIAAFIPNDPVWGPFYLQGVVLFGLYAAGIASAMLVAFVLRKLFLTGERTPLILEMPDYRLPCWRNVLLGLLERAKIFINRAGRIILPLMVLVWFLSTYPSAPEGAEGPDILYSFAGMMGQFLAPIFAPLGFNWQMVVALIPGMAAREVAVGVLGTVYAVSAEENIDSLAEALASAWSLPTALAFLTWYIFAPQCLPTLGVAKRETNSWFWMWVMLGYLMALAYVCSLLAFNISQSLLGA